VQLVFPIQLGIATALNTHFDLQVLSGAGFASAATAGTVVGQQPGAAGTGQTPSRVRHLDPLIHPFIGALMNRTLTPHPLALAVIALIAGNSAQAADIDFGAVFSLKGQSVYAPGAAVDVNTNERLGPAPFNLGKEYGAIVDICPIIDCPSGIRAGANVNGNFGLRYGAKFNSGSYDLLYPVLAHIEVPTAYANTVATPFRLGTSFKIPGYGAPAYQEYLNGQRMVAKLTTHSPTLQAYVDLDARFHAFLGAQACLAGACTGPALGPIDVDASRNLASINRNNDGLIKVGDSTVNLRQYFPTLDGNLTARLNIPNIDAVSNPSTSAAGNLRSFGRDNIAVLGANVGNIVSKAIGIPLVGNAGGMGYNLMSVNAGLGFDVAQTISVALTPIETFNFLSPVQRQLEGGGWSAPTNQVVIPLGQDLVLKSNARNLGVVPSTSLEVTFSNLTELVVQGDFNVQALAADIYGLKIGPLYDSGTVNAGAFSIPLYQNSFSFAMGAVTGLPFNLVQGISDSVALDFGHRASFVVGDQNAQGLESAEIRSQDLNCLILICAPVHYADADPSMLNQAGERVFMVDGETLDLAVNNPGEVGTDASQLALLYATGYSPDRIALVAPIGLPSPIPEPASWALMLMGFAALGGAVRRRTGAAPQALAARALRSRPSMAST
jgi:hypothetical protein